MSELVDAARSALRTVADPERAPRQQAYMRSAMPFHGVGVPQARAVARGLVESNPFATAGQWREGVAELSSCFHDGGWTVVAWDGESAPDLG